MIELSHAHQDVLCRVLDFAERIQTNEWVGYVLWEVVERIRRPVSFWPEMPPTLMDDMTTLRDDARVWFQWDWDENYWSLTPIEQWRAHARTCSSSEAIKAASERMRLRDAKKE